MYPNQWGWSSGSSLIATTGGTGMTIYPTAINITPQLTALPGVLESPAAELGDREWLDAQIAEVCGLAEAA